MSTPPPPRFDPGLTLIAVALLLALVIALTVT